MKHRDAKSTNSAIKINKYIHKNLIQQDLIFQNAEPKLHVECHAICRLFKIKIQTDTLPSRTGTLSLLYRLIDC